MGIMKIMDGTGHTTRKWDGSDPASVLTTSELFNKLTELGQRAFQADTPGGTATLTKEFDPNAAEIVMTPALQGG